MRPALTTRACLSFHWTRRQLCQSGQTDCVQSQLGRQCLAAVTNIAITEKCSALNNIGPDHANYCFSQTVSVGGAGCSSEVAGSLHGTRRVSLRVVYSAGLHKQLTLLVMQSWRGHHNNSRCQPSLTGPCRTRPPSTSQSTAPTAGSPSAATPRTSRPPRSPPAASPG